MSPFFTSNGRANAAAEGFSKQQNVLHFCSPEILKHLFVMTLANVGHTHRDVAEVSRYYRHSPHPHVIITPPSADDRIAG